MSDVIPFATFNPSKNAATYAANAISSGWVSGGPYIDKLESNLSELYNNTPVLAVSNGTSALQLAFQTIDIKPNDKVLLPSFCFQAAFNVLNTLGAIPILADICPLTWNLSLEKILKVDISDLRAVVVVHNYGFCADIEEISLWCKQNNIILIEDCAESFLSSYSNNFAGLFGDISTVSMHATKTLSCGEGGLVIINNKEYLAKARLIRSHGLDRQSTPYFHLEAGNNFRLSNIMAAVACGQLEELDQTISWQETVFKTYRSSLQSINRISFQRSYINSIPRVWANTILINTSFMPIKRDNIIKMLSSHGIETRPGFYLPIHFNYPRSLVYADLTVSTRIASESIVLPCSSSISSSSQVYFIADVISNIINMNDPITVQTYAENPTAFVVDLAYLFEDMSKCSSFRYYNRRELTTCAFHMLTLLLKYEGSPVAYGHIEQNDGFNWIGVYTTSDLRGSGLGGYVLSIIINYALDNAISKLSLMVDKSNSIAQNLYSKYGFVRNKCFDLDTSYYMELVLSPFFPAN